MSDFRCIICPVCQNPLKESRPGSLSCNLGHSFDISGKGYVNLLLSQDKKSKDPGDSKDMVKARKSFLDKGYYKPLAEGLASLGPKYLPSTGGFCLLDAGCGEGYYTHYLKKKWCKDLSKHCFYGIDISKEAIRLAAGRDRDIKFIVASLFKIPFSNHSANIILNAFAPSSDGEFVRIIKKDGYLFTVIPGRSHLIELKGILYDNPYDNDEKEPELPSFMVKDQVRIKSTIKLDSLEDIYNLVAMTPYYWRTPKEGLERLNKLSYLETVIEFIISIYSLK